MNMPPTSTRDCSSSGLPSRRWFLRPLKFFAGTLVVCVFVTASLMWAKPPPSKKKPGEDRPVVAPTATASVRFWRTDLRDLAALRLVLTPAGGKRAASLPLGGGGAGYLFTNYLNVPAGSCTLDLLDGTSPSPLASIPVDLGAGSYFTALLMEPLKAGDPPRLEVIEDRDSRSGPADTAATQITVRNLLLGLKDARVNVGETLSAQFGPGAFYLVMNGLMPATYQVHTVGTTPDGKPFEWTVEADFKLHRRQTLLIYPDSYGRIRPRLSVDGESVPEPPTGEGGQN